MSLKPSEKAILLETKKRLKTWTGILNDAQGRLSGTLTKRFVNENFSEAVRLLNFKAYEIFQGYEKEAFPYLITRWMEENGAEVERLHKEGVTKSLDGQGTLKEVLKDVVNKVIHQSYPVVSSFETSVAQMRKKRGGETFQETIVRLLNLIDIHAQTAKGRKEADLSHTDIAVPDVPTALESPDQSAFIACQHTLAERWWAATPMADRGGAAYIVTMDERLRAPKAQRIKLERLSVYVLDAVKNTPDLKDLAWVRSLNRLPADLRRISGQ